MLNGTGRLAGPRVAPRAATGLLVATIAAPIMLALLAHTPNIIDAPIFPDEPRDLPHLQVELAYDELPRPAGPNTARLRLDLADPSALLPRDQIGILMQTFGTRPALIEGQLKVLGTECVYRTPVNAPLADQDLLVFMRSSSCNPVRGAPTGQLELLVTFRGAGRIGVLSRLPLRPTDDATTIYVPAREADAPYRPALLGTYAITAGRDTTRRVDLLNYTWQLTSSPWWIWTALAGSLLLIVAGIRVFPWDQEAAAPIASGAAAACFAGALAVAYVVLVPPFQAPDEPDHLLAYAATAARPELVPEIEEWARVTHFERIRFHWFQKFRAGDIGRPHPVPWTSDTWAEDVRARSVTTYALWTAVARVIPKMDVQPTFLILRLVNAFLFACAMGLACGFVAWCSRTSAAHVAWFPFLFVPTLPFFGMHVSEFALLTSIYILVAAAVLAVFIGGPQSHFAGVLLGVGGAVLMVSGRSTMPLMPVLVAVALGRAIVGQPAQATIAMQIRSAAVFWVGLALGVPALWLLSTSSYRVLLAEYIGRAAPALRMLGPPDRAIDAVTTFGPGLVAVGTLFVLSGFIVEVVLGFVRNYLPRQLLRIIARVAGLAAVAMVVASMIGTFSQDLPHATVLRPAVSDYVADVVRTVGTTFRFRDPDPYLSMSFWVGFGWLDTMPAPAFVVALTTAVGLALAALLWRLGMERDARRLLLLAVYAVACCVSLMLYAASVHSLNRVLVGRYLIGLYLVMLVISWSGLLLFVSSAGLKSSATAISSPESRRRTSLLSETPLAAGLLTLCGVVHSYCLSFIVMRYF